jgi:Peptidase M50B-like
MNNHLRGAAFHEAGHVVVARFFGLTVRKIEIGKDGSGNAEISSAEHLPLIDQIALCVAGIEAQALFNCPTHQYVAISDYAKVIELVEGVTEAESFELRSAAYLRALEILKDRLPEVEQLADDLIKQRRIG